MWRFLPYFNVHKVLSFYFPLDSDLFFGKPIATLPKTCEDHPDSFFKSVRTLVLIAQYLAILPVTGTGGTKIVSGQNFISPFDEHC